MKIDDNELCPCGSGNLYKDCCKNRTPTQNLSKKPPEVQAMEMMRSSMKECCLHPDQANCRGKIKKAHALQNNKIISLLAGNERHVYMLDPKKTPKLFHISENKVYPFVEISRVSANDATTETCFCDYHDNTVFAVIEKGAPDFNANSDEMKFVYAYKAFIFEYYKQLMQVEIFQRCFKINPPAFTQPDMIGMYRMIQLKSQEFEPVKRHFDNQIMAGTYEGVYTCYANIPGQIKFADFAYIAPDYDLNGGRIKHTNNGMMHRIAITIFPETTQSWLLISCLEKERPIYESFFAQIKEASLEKLKFYLNLILPLYSENMVLSGELWDSWGAEIQMKYTRYANLQGRDAVLMGKAIGFSLKNAYRSKTETVYLNHSGINLFA